MKEDVTHFRNQKVTAPLKLVYGSRVVLGLSDFRNQKVTAPLKHGKANVPSRGFSLFP